MSAVERLRRIPGRLRPRRARVYGVGIAKSGTTTLAAMFGRYRAAHELDAARMLPLGAAVMRGELAPDDPRVVRELRRRSWRFGLEVDVAPFLNPVAGTLADLYDDARLVLTIRDCFSWLDSRIEWDRAHPASTVPMFADFRAAQYHGHDDGFTEHDEVLRREGLRSVSSYLRSWAEHNQAVIDAVPSERLLVVRTEDLDSSAAALADFAGVPVASVVPAHEKHNADRSGVLSRIDRDYVAGCAREHCGGLMATYWGAQWIELVAKLSA